MVMPFGMNKEMRRLVCKAFGHRKVHRLLVVIRCPPAPEPERYLTDFVVCRRCEDEFESTDLPKTHRLNKMLRAGELFWDHEGWVMGLPLWGGR